MFVYIFFVFHPPPQVMIKSIYREFLLPNIQCGFICFSLV
jgi:hypothetical protein